MSGKDIADIKEQHWTKRSSVFNKRERQDDFGISLNQHVAAQRISIGIVGEDILTRSCTRAERVPFKSAHGTITASKEVFEKGIGVGTAVGITITELRTQLERKASKQGEVDLPFVLQLVKEGIAARYRNLHAKFLRIAASREKPTIQAHV